MKGLPKAHVTATPKAIPPLMITPDKYLMFSRSLGTGEIGTRYQFIHDVSKITISLITQFHLHVQARMVNTKQSNEDDIQSFDP